eukprot:CAMPEP_0206464446 /NCGR_PEP_ID=MMETSP0324_2-20121206/27223_1 /ASSEMBLY_ACC=CAM_ASM_000836 /TAXON_ID=2866 /ORGANISM="Crypthecodinium cohnii, Strain Seligo" /LENGTH=60 /DNA_ID=CAMNT_0053937083 /DNA_START=113 /DNA_END=295 /DNA_ORIENTATION=-
MRGACLASGTGWSTEEPGHAHPRATDHEIRNISIYLQVEAIILWRQCKAGQVNQRILGIL